MRLELRLLFWIHCQIVKKKLLLTSFKQKQNNKNTINKNNTKNKTKKKNKRLPDPVWHLSRQET